MKPIELQEISSLQDYEKQRTDFRSTVIEYKKKRRIFLGPEMSVLFEDRLTVRHQIQEVLRAEKLSLEQTVLEEIAIYNELLAPHGAFTATLMIELSDPNEREVRKKDYLGLESHIHLEAGGRRWTGVFDPRGLHGDRIAVVQYVTWTMGDDGAKALIALADSAAITCTHPRYGYSTKLGRELAIALATDVAS